MLLTAFTVLRVPEQGNGVPGLPRLGQALERLLRHVRALGRRPLPGDRPRRLRPPPRGVHARLSRPRPRRRMRSPARTSSRQSLISLAAATAGVYFTSRIACTPRRRARRARHGDPARPLPGLVRLHGALLRGPVPRGVGRRGALLLPRPVLDRRPARRPRGRHPRPRPRADPGHAHPRVAGRPQARPPHAGAARALPLAALRRHRGLLPARAVGDSLAFLHAQKTWGRHVSTLGPLDAIWRVDQGDLPRDRDPRRSAGATRASRASPPRT